MTKCYTVTEPTVVNDPVVQECS